MSQPKVLLGINYYSGKENERAKYLDKFLKSIYKYTTNYPELDIVIFDDCSPYKPLCAEKIIVADKPGIRWHRVRNRIYQYFLDHPEYQYLFAYDEDYEVITDNWINHIVGCMENIPQIGVLCSHYARLADAKTYQLQHLPYCFECKNHSYVCGHLAMLHENGFQVRTTNWATGGCWTLRREIVRLYPDDGSVIYDNGHPGADTWNGWDMMSNSSYKLCTTMTDLVFHRGQEFMVGKFATKYDSEEYKTGKRLY